MVSMGRDHGSVGLCISVLNLELIERWEVKNFGEFLPLFLPGMPTVLLSERDLVLRGRGGFSLIGSP